MKGTATVTPSHGPGPAPLGPARAIPRKLSVHRDISLSQMAGGESKEEEKEGQPSPFKFSGQIPGARCISVHSARPPGPRDESLRDSEPLRTNLKNKDPPAILQWPRPARGGVGTRKSPEKFNFSLFVPTPAARDAAASASLRGRWRGSR
jgi:hypothetical protein